MKITDRERIRQSLLLLLPMVGEDVIITMENRSATLTGPLKSVTPDTYDLVGKVCTKSRKIDQDPDNFAIWMQGSPVPLRIINIFKVKAINGVAVIAKQSVKKASKTFNVKGSGNANYIVKFDGTHWSCNCPGYHFRKFCRHVKETREQYEKQD